MKRFRGIIDNPDTRHKELAVAIKGYGYFAKVKCYLTLSCILILNYVSKNTLVRGMHQDYIVIFGGKF